MADPRPAPSAAEATEPPIASRPARGGARGSILPLELDAVCLDVNGRRLINGLDLHIDAGGPTVILGPNGAGKSLTLRLCHGLIRPSAGRVAWLGAPDGADVRRRQAMVFQRPVLLRRSAAANVSYALALRRVPRRERARRTREALDMAGLAELADRPARVLSGGEQQRLALARAWALDPDVLFLDEPTASLDPAATRAVELLVERFAAAGAKVIMTTHDLGQARRLAHEVLFLHRGRLREQAPAARFFAAPGTPEGQAFIAGDLIW